MLVRGGRRSWTRAASIHRSGGFRVHRVHPGIRQLPHNLHPPLSYPAFQQIVDARHRQNHDSHSNTDESDDPTAESAASLHPRRCRWNTRRILSFHNVENARVECLLRSSPWIDDSHQAIRPWRDINHWPVEPQQYGGYFGYEELCRSESSVPRGEWCSGNEGHVDRAA